jgi:hemolysin activation/secretion protein
MPRNNGTTRNAQREAEERQQRQQAPDIHLPQPPAAAEITGLDLPAESPCFQIDRVRLDGERLTSFAWAQAYLEQYAGRCVERAGIALIAKRLSALILSEGFVTTRIGIPEQNLSERILHLVLIPGVIRAIRFADDTPAGDWRSAFPARPGDLLNLRDIEQGLEQMKRLPSQDVDIEIVPGEAAGESDIVIHAKRTAPWRLGFSLDDAGARTTGKRQASIILAIDNPLGLNDQYNVSINNDAQDQASEHGTRGHSLQYSVPWGYWTLALSDSASRYHQRIQGVNQTFVSSGDSVNQDIRIQRLIHRDQVSKTTLSFRASQRIQHSFIDDTEIAVQRRHTAAAELGVAHRRQLGPFQIDISLARREGVPWFGGQSDTGSRVPESPTYRYHMHIVDIAAQAPFKLGEQPLRWIGVLHGQTTPDVLYAADQIAIGNRYTVRGFDGENTLAGERGLYLRNELEFALADSGHALYVGLDQGRVAGPSADALVGRSLAGAVLGIRGGAFGLAYDLFTSRALRKPEAFGTAQPALGFQLSYQF